MTNKTLAQSYLVKASKRLKILPVLFDETAYSDVDAQRAMDDARLVVSLAAMVIPPPSRV